jgi:hypothetical protein
MIASRTGSGAVISQMAMLLESYRTEMRTRQEKLLADANKNPNFKNIIDIQ